MSEAPFWIVWNPKHAGPISLDKKYYTRKAATKAARSLARVGAATGAYYFVMKAQSCHQEQVDMVDFIFSPWLRAPCSSVVER